MALFTVISAADSGSGTLRQAISDASSGDTIAFDDGISNITLTSGEINVDKSLTINGPGSNLLTISGNNASRVFNVSSGSVVAINGILFADGHSSNGGAIYNAGVLTVTNSEFSGNTSDMGGAIYNSFGTFTATNSAFSGNAAMQYGGAIFNSFGTFTIISSTCSGNTARDYGGAIFNNDGIFTIINSTFSGNTDAYFGGAIFNYGTFTITNSTFSGNDASMGGAICSGYGIFTITNSTFSGNTSMWGGAIYNDYGTFTITNSTLSGNTAPQLGGAIYNNGGALEISFSTIAENQSANGAAVNSSTERVTFKNSIVGNNHGQNYGGETLISALGINFDTDGTCPGFMQVTSAQLNLGQLALNAPGTTQTQALLSGSVAIDSVTDCTDIAGNPVTTDQRGIPRPQGIACDAGAYETKAPCRGVLFIDS